MRRTTVVIQGLVVGGKEIGVNCLSNGFHTFDELYAHRDLLFLALMSATFWSRKQPRCWVSKCHENGSIFDRCFIAGIDLPSGTITYHLPLSMWELIDTGIARLPRAPAWDGHTPDDVLRRLAEYIKPGTIKKRRPKKGKSMWPKMTPPPSPSSP